MSDSILEYRKQYSIDILDHAEDDEQNCIVYFFMAELCYVKVPKGITLVMIYPYDWNRLMTPWEYIPSNAMGKTGGGKEFAESLWEEVVMSTERTLGHTYSKRYIGGYSLGGLMAAYIGTVLPGFHGVISCSGSFWYPGAVQYFHAHPYLSEVDTVYYSLGTKESLTAHPERCKVEENTRELYKSAQLQNIKKTTLEMNEGGHFTNIPERIAKALQFIIHSGCQT